MRRALIYIFFVINACSSGDKKAVEEGDKQYVQYASTFRVFKYDDITQLQITTPYQGAEESFEYWLIPKTAAIPDTLTEKKIIRTPINTMVATSTSHLPMLEMLDKTESLVGFPSLQYISSEVQRARIDSGLVAELGRDSDLNYEVLVKLSPDLVMNYLIQGDMSKIIRIENTGIPVLINADYLEQHPLGRAEWIKVGGLLFDKEKEADSIFNHIAKRYNNLSDKAKSLNNKPTVLTGIMYSDPWYLPGGENYAANLFKDAGLDYLWSENQESGFLQLNFEAVYQKAKTADLWIGTANIESLESLKEANSRYTWFEAYKEGEVYTYTNRIGPTGGNEYLELGYMRPDFILADLIKIGHPELLPTWDLYFYKKLEK